jgi:hypothetical protein
MMKMLSKDDLVLAGPPNDLALQRGTVALDLYRRTVTSSQSIPMPSTSEVNEGVYCTSMTTRWVKWLRSSQTGAVVVVVGIEGYWQMLRYYSPGEWHNQWLEFRPFLLFFIGYISLKKRLCILPPCFTVIFSGWSNFQIVSHLECHLSFFVFRLHQWRRRSPRYVVLCIVLSVILPC